eukprot:g5082.t1
MAEEPEKSYLCSACNLQHPKNKYSSKQLKNKGKRKCNDCVAAGAAPAAQNQESAAAVVQGSVSLAGTFFADKKSKEIVKSVKASDVMKAQEKLKAEDKTVISPDNDKFDNLITWLKDGGAAFPNLIMKFYTVDYRGVHARRRLEKDELILSVPLPLIITTEVAKESDIGQRIKNSGCQLYSDHSWLAAFLLQEKYNATSKWRPYLDILPVHYRNMPLFFDDEELGWLKGSFTTKMISDRKFSLRLEYDNICKYVPEFSQYHHLDFSWARVAVITRVFGFEVAGEKTEGLVAMADMLNHKRPNETAWTFDDSMNAFTITTTKRLLKSSQIFDSYGRKCNSRFFVNYGFALDFNEDNQVAIFVSLDKDDPRYALKSKLLGRESANQKRRFQIAFEHKERCTKKCMSFLRICHATLEDLTAISDLPSTSIIDPLNPANEYKVMESVAEACKEVLAGFDTSLEEDRKLLKQDDLTMNIRACVVMRLGEKEILDAYIRLFEHLKLLKDMEVRDVQKYIAKHIKGKGKEPTIEWRMEMYFQEWWIPLLQGKKLELEEMNNSLGE